MKDHGKSRVQMSSLETKIKAPKSPYVVPIALDFVCLFLFRPALLVLIPLTVFWFWYIRHGSIKLKDSDCVLMFGLPGSGKTMIMTKIVRDNKSRYAIWSNKEYDCVLVDKKICKEQLGTEDLSHVCVAWDEASLNGFDNRNFSTNFKAEGVLDYFKEHRKCQSPILMTNQGWDELDCKIRESLQDKLYFCKPGRFFVKGIRLYRYVALVDGQPSVRYRLPSFLDVLIEPSCIIYANKRKIGSLYNSMAVRRNSEKDPFPIQ